MENSPPNKPQVPNGEVRTPRMFSDDDVACVLSSLDSIDEDASEDRYDDDAEDQYTRILRLTFPEEIQQEFAIRRIDLPIRKILEWATRELPAEAEALCAIRDDYYGGDHEDDYVFGPSEWVYATTPWTAEELARRRLARAAGRKQRAVRRAKLEIDHAKQRIDDLSREIDRNEGRLTPLERLMADRERDEAEIAKMNDELDAAWESFLSELAKGNHDQNFDRETRAKLSAMEKKIRGELESKIAAISAAQGSRMNRPDQGVEIPAAPTTSSYPS